MNIVLIFDVYTSATRITLQLPLAVRFVPAVGTLILPPMRAEENADEQTNISREPQPAARMPAAFKIQKIGYQVDQKLVKLYCSYFCESEEELKALAQAVRLKYGLVELAGDAETAFSLN